MVHFLPSSSNYSCLAARNQPTTPSQGVVSQPSTVRSLWAHVVFKPISGCPISDPQMHPVSWKKPVVYGLGLGCQSQWVPTLQENGLGAITPSMSDEIHWNPPFFWYLLLLKWRNPPLFFSQQIPKKHFCWPAAKPRKSFSELPGGGGQLTTRSVGDLDQRWSNMIKDDQRSG